MSEHRYVLIGADKCGEFFEHRSDDPIELLRERDAYAPRRDRTFFVIDLMRVDGAPDGGDHGEVEWCDSCGCCAVPALPGEPSECEACQDEIKCPDEVPA